MIFDEESTKARIPLQPSEVLAKALQYVLVSPNESDRNGEAANLVDAGFAIARAGFAIAQELEHVARAIREEGR
jgi:hypothetical protein